MKKLCFIIVIVLLSLTAACQNKNPPAEEPSVEVQAIDEPEPATQLNGPEFHEMSIALITDKHDASEWFASLAWQGLQEIGGSTLAKTSIYEAAQQSEYATKIQAAINEKATIVVGIGPGISKDLEKAAKENAEVTFICLNHAYNEKNMPSNLAGISFKEQEAAFLTGIIAGKTTQSGKIGVICGDKGNDLSERYRKGFEAGVKQANPEAQLTVKYERDPQKSVNLTDELIAADCDVLFCTPDTAIKNIATAATAKKVWLIGSGQDWWHLSNDYVLSSAVIHADAVVRSVVAEFKTGVMTGGRNYEFGVAEGAVGIASSSQINVENAILNEVNDYVNRIKTGEFNGVLGIN